MKASSNPASKHIVRFFLFYGLLAMAFSGFLTLGAGWKGWMSLFMFCCPNPISVLFVVIALAITRIVALTERRKQSPENVTEKSPIRPYRHAARFALAFLAMVTLFIFLNANIKWTGYNQAVINVITALCQGNLLWLLLLVMAGLIVYIVRDF